MPKVVPHQREALQTRASIDRLMRQQAKSARVELRRTRPRDKRRG